MPKPTSFSFQIPPQGELGFGCFTNLPSCHSTLKAPHAFSDSSHKIFPPWWLPAQEKSKTLAGKWETRTYSPPLPTPDPKKPTATHPKPEKTRQLSKPSAKTVQAAFRLRPQGLWRDLGGRALDVSHALGLKEVPGLHACGRDAMGPEPRKPKPPAKHAKALTWEGEHLFFFFFFFFFFTFSSYVVGFQPLNHNKQKCEMFPNNHHAVERLDGYPIYSL